MTYTADETLINLNTTIETLLREYLPSSDELTIRFDLPEDMNTPSENTVSVFLYSIQEDLERRIGKGRQYNIMNGTLEPDFTNIRCCYLITYWDASSGSGETGPGNQTITTMNQVLNALINNRTLPDFPNSYSKILPPSEHLNSLGNFWQSMGDKPRLCLNYEVTVPISLTDKTDSVAPIRSTTTQLQQKPDIDIYLQAANALKVLLYQSLNSPTTLDENSKAEFRKLAIICTPHLSDTTDSSANYSVDMSLIGTTSSSLYSSITAIIETWVSETSAITEIGGKGVVVVSTDTTRFISAPDAYDS